MATPRYLFQDILRARLAEARVKMSGTVLLGMCGNYADYRELVGYIRALDEIEAVCEDIRKKFLET